MKVMQMREFLRGGYKDIRELTLVTNHNRPAFTVNPHPYKKKAIDIDDPAVSVSYTSDVVLGESRYRQADR